MRRRAKRSHTKRCSTSEPRGRLRARGLAPNPALATFGFSSLAILFSFLVLWFPEQDSTAPAERNHHRNCSYQGGRLPLGSYQPCMWTLSNSGTYSPPQSRVCPPTSTAATNPPPREQQHLRATPRHLNKERQRLAAMQGARAAGGCPSSRGVPSPARPGAARGAAPEPQVGLRGRHGRGAAGPGMRHSSGCRNLHPFQRGRRN